MTTALNPISGAQPTSATTTALTPASGSYVRRDKSCRDKSFFIGFIDVYW
jgi:hypothetical protein